MYSNNEENLGQEENISEFSKYRIKMNSIKKWTNYAFFANVPYLIGQITMLLAGIASLNLTGTLFKAIFSLLLCSFIAVMATYKKNKYFAYGTFAFYFIFAMTPINMLLALPVFAVYPFYIKSLYDEDKLKLIDGYPYFDERGSTYRELYGIEEGSMKDMTYKNPERDNINELPENIEIYNGEMFASENLYMEDAPDGDSEQLPNAEAYSGLTFISDNLYMEDVSVPPAESENENPVL